MTSGRALHLSPWMQLEVRKPEAPRRRWSGVFPRAAIAAIALLAVGAAGLPPAASAQSHDPCPDAPAPEFFLDWESSLENLAFDGAGSLYLSDAGGARILQVDPAGVVTREIGVDAHGIAWGPDGRLYAAVTAGEAYDIQRSTDASVTGFEVYAAGLPVYNGMAFDAIGNLYVSDDSVTPPAQPPDLVRVPRAAPSDWAPWTDLYGPNGLAFDAATGWMYTVITADQASPVLRVSTSEPATAEAVTYLSFGAATLGPSAHEPQGDPAYPVPKGLDDLAIGPDGMLYITAHLAGELLRVDPATGSACVLASGLEEPTSARFAHGFGGHGGKLFVTTWGGTGITGIALGSVDRHPAGNVWAFDFGFGEPGPVVATPSFTMTGSPSAPPPSGNGTTLPLDDGKDSPLGVLVPAAALALALWTARKRIR